MLRPTLLYCLTPILTIAALAAPAAAQDDRWQVRLDGVLVEPDAHFTGLDDGVLGADGSAGFGFAVERRSSRRLGLELGALFAEPSVNLDAAAGDGRLVASNNVNFRAISLGLNLHLTPDKPVDLYLGPLLAHVDYGSLRFAGQSGGQLVAVDVSSSDNFTVGAQVGADVAFGDSPWSLNLIARYLDSSIDAAADGGPVNQVDFDPLIVGVGVGFRF